MNLSFTLQIPRWMAIVILSLIFIDIAIKIIGIIIKKQVRDELRKK